ncbi:MAG: hypothetical protein A3F84_14635 [Candidatus Handelsmanbacteria bacterium RIFCSPLOWO2_12_FULL_64_10]|uniref:Rho termination factor N-terminal domain-containing protein n=1 Tax=Handelsmanbacteria sp. (strain RIFCSPLOWO2_12_FULL_64_10) TaxID=1817868 RepID=A0A1F6CDF4_HANXR|nr:MAG: hypothetical protein A3F84_14635 [Candidatus Handelsmanbacteria bacterium RIFCSPLOWO2_12_FULL_64_10]
MAHTYEELRKMSVTQLREIAKDIEHEALQGHSGMHKEHLLPALCKALGIDARAHHVAVVANKREIKGQIHKLKTEREAALQAHDHKQLKMVRRKIHRLKRELRKAMV